MAFDPGLTKKGKSQAEEIAKFLHKYKFEAVFTSLYLRAQETAKIVNKKSAPVFATNAFNEYYVRKDGTNVETISQAQDRAMTKLYSIFGQYENILIVAHSSLNQTIIQSILNLKYDEARTYYENFGETQVLRYDYENEGETNWRIIDSFTPSQT